jgi:hypothetical protein
MKSSDFDSVNEYAIEKIGSLYRFYSDLPWDRILSVANRIQCYVHGDKASSAQESNRTYATAGTK